VWPVTNQKVGSLEGSNILHYLSDIRTLSMTELVLQVASVHLNLSMMSEPTPVSYDLIPAHLIGSFLPPLSISIVALLRFNLVPSMDTHDFATKNELFGSPDSPNVDITNSLLRKLPPPPLGQVQQLLRHISTNARSIGFGRRRLPPCMLYVWSALAKVHTI
jgi:hypothetical protein